MNDEVVRKHWNWTVRQQLRHRFGPYLALSPQLCTTLHTPCAVIYFVPRLEPDLVLEPDAVSKLGASGRDRDGL